MPETVYTFTLAQLAAWIAGCCGFITAVAAAWAVVWKLIQAARGPNAKQDARLSALENRMQTLETSIVSKGEDINQIKSDNRVTQEALLALLAHGISGNSIEAMERARDQLTRRLIDK